MSDTNDTNKGRKVTFEILGKNYVLFVRDESESAIRRAAKRLSERVSQFAQKYKGTKLASEDLLVYAAVEIITTCYEEKDNNQDAQTQSALISLEQRLDDILKGEE
ncbi:MAG: cell division protein ZapA [Bacteroidales bacterium]|nr:cell division protein ZapA [Bacteroidales bacterium]